MAECLKAGDIVIPADVIEDIETEDDFEKYFRSVMAKNNLTEGNTDLFYKPDDGSIVLRCVEDGSKQGEAGIN